MRQRLSNPVLADRGVRLAGVGFTDRLVPRAASAFPTAQASQASNPCADPAAPPIPPGGAAFSHYTESGSQVATGPDQPAEAGATVFAGTLSAHTMILLRAVASYEQCTNERAITLALAEYARKIGCGPLARAVLDERERLDRRLANDVPDDLGDLPEFVRRDQVRGASLGAREADWDKTFQGMRR